mmetsp:Transcript_3496/g.7002  ORF Transcript_3496/g.7002 Transcript_3496/m.7002 type:complete len:525 (-) Transcript_3496:94-1668(-)
MKSILVICVLIAVVAVDAGSTGGRSLPPPNKIAAWTDSDSQLTGRLTLVDGGRMVLPLQTLEWGARSSSPMQFTTPQEIKSAVFYLDERDIHARRRAQAQVAEVEEDGSFGKTDMDIQMAEKTQDGDGDEPDTVSDEDQDQAFLDEFDMEIQEDEILAYKEAEAGGDDMSVQDIGDYLFKTQEGKIIDNETAEKQILENEAAIESAKVDEIKEEENLLQKAVDDQKIEPGLADEEMAKLKETLEKEEEKLKEKEVFWGHQVDIPNDNIETEEDETYLSIKKLENKTIYHRCAVVQAMDGPDDVVPVVYCEFFTPVGLPAKAEILDGDCTSFTNEANSTYFTEGVASAVHIATLTDEEKRQGIFDHTYCARLDFVYEGKSVVEKRYLMGITYHYLVDKKSGEVQGLLSADVHDENSGVEKRNEAVAIGLGVFGGIIVTLALVAIIFGKKRRQKREVLEGRDLYSRSGEDVELVNAPSLEAVNEAFQVGESFGSGEEGADVTDGDYEALAAVRESERREREENELV